MSERPPPKLLGNDKLTVWLNQLRDFAVSSRVVSVYNALIDPGTDGIVLKAKPGGGGTSTQLKQVTLIKVWGDYLECRDAAGATCYVAKPLKMRTSILSEILDGATVNYTITSHTGRTASISGIDETTGIPVDITEAQVYVPRYLPKVTGGYAGDVITIQAMPQVLNADGSTVKDAGGIAVVWLDTNSDGRAWST